MTTRQAMSEPPKPREGTESDEITCDFCGKWVALVYCRADDARLCLACDRHVHAANTVAFKHLRSLLCNSCNSASSTILCSTHQLLFCHNCDFQNHNEDNHERRPVEPFSGCPSSLELFDVLGVGGGDEKGFVDLDCGGDGDELVRERESWVWETAPVLSWDDLVVPTSDQHPFTAVGVPPLPKNRNSSCGKQREEILRQLQSVIKSEASINNQFWEDEGDNNQMLMFQTESGKLCVNDSQADLMGTYEENILVWPQNDNSQQTCSEVPFLHDYLPEKSVQESKTCHDTVDGDDGKANQSNSCALVHEHPISGEDAALALPTKSSSHELFGPDRDIALTRYKEKRKTRRYDKHVRYESRKARAEGRVRIRGRFAKVTTNPNPRD